MPGMAVREFECTLCRQKFSLLSGDLFFPGPNICDDCLEEVWELESEELAKHVAGRVASEEKIGVNSIVRHIKWHRERWGSAEEAIGNREQMRQALR